MTTVSPAPRSAAIRFEADMLRPIASSLDQLNRFHPRSGTWHTLFEVPNANGVADIVRVRVDDRAMRRRAEHDIRAIADLRGVQTVLDLLRAGGRASPDEVAARGQISEARMRKIVLPALVDSGWVRFGRRGEARALAHPGKAVLDVIVIEAKVSAISRGVGQVFRYLSGADFGYLALAATTTQRQERVARELSGYGLGCIVTDLHQASVLCTATRNTRPEPWYRAHLAETALSMITSGTASGAVREVFGQSLLATTGADARFAGAWAGFPREARALPAGPLP